MDSIPDPSLIVLVGPSGSGKSTWAASRFRPEEVVSSDRLRAVVGSGEGDLEASDPAFSLLDQIVAERVRRRLLTVVDTLGLDDERRHRHLALARELGLPAVLVVFDVPDELSRARNRARSRPVPASVLTSQIRRFRAIRPRLDSEGWRVLAAADSTTITPAHQPTAPATIDPAPIGSVGSDSDQPLTFYLQISRFPDQQPLGSWLQSMAVAAEESGFAGVAVMDHLVQIPQVGREWEVIPEAYVALGFLAGVTRRIELGTLVTGVGLRNPALLAKMVATLDVVSGGRAFCGIGAGWFESEQASYGYDFRPPAERIAALEDTLRILQLMWGPGQASYLGKVHSVSGAVCYPRPLHPIPVIVGGSGDRIIRLACRHADGVNVVGAARLTDRIEMVRSSLREAQRDPAAFSISVLDTPLLGTNRSEVAALLEVHRGRLAAPVFAARHHAGTVDYQVDRFRRVSRAGCRSVFLAPVGLERPDDVIRWQPVLEAVGSRA